MTAVEKLLTDAVLLPMDQRLTLVSRLLETAEPTVSDEVEESWDNEIRERIARYDQGLSSSRPAGEVFAELDRRLSE